jgi:putative peptidoglycan lipid II flippase
LVATLLGFSRFTDAYNYATNLIRIFYSLISDSILAGIIPFLNDQKTDQEKVNFVYSTFLVVALVYIVLTVAILMNFEHVLSLIAPGFDAQSVSMVIKLFAILIPSVFLNLFTKVIDGYFRAEKVFGITNFSKLLAAILVIFIIAVFLTDDITILAYSTVAGSAFTVLIFLFFSPKKITAFDTGVFSLLRFSIPLLLGGSIGIINGLIDKGFATTLDEGVLSLLAYGTLISNQVITMFKSPLTGASFSFIAKDISEGKTSEVQARLDRLTNIIVALFSVTILTFLIAGDFGLRLVFLHGKVEAAEIPLLFNFTGIYFLVALFSVIQGIQGSVLMSLKITVFPTITSVLALGMNILLNYLFIDHFGGYALAGATVVASVFHTFTYTVYLSTRFKYITYRWKHLLLVILTIACTVSVVIFPEYHYQISIAGFVFAILLSLGLKLVQPRLLRQQLFGKKKSK